MYVCVCEKARERVCVCVCVCVCLYRGGSCLEAQAFNLIQVSREEVAGVGVWVGVAARSVESTQIWREREGAREGGRALVEQKAHLSSFIMTHLQRIPHTPLHFVRENGLEYPRVISMSGTHLSLSHSLFYTAKLPGLYTACVVVVVVIVVAATTCVDGVMVPFSEVA